MVAIADLRTDRFLRARVAPAGETDEHPLEHDPIARVAIGGMTIGPKRHLAGAVRRAYPRTLDRDDAPAEDDLARLLAMAVSRACRVGLAALSSPVTGPNDAGRPSCSGDVSRQQTGLTRARPAPQEGGPSAQPRGPLEGE